jgi:Lrp/AsnC family transcriptional regulator, leucine-responsive regulatory protein
MATPSSTTVDDDSYKYGPRTRITCSRTRAQPHHLTRTAGHDMEDAGRLLSQAWIRRLEQAGVIEGYHARINSSAVGLTVTAFLQLHCHPGRCLLKTSVAEKFPEIVEIHRDSGNSCTMVKVRTASMAHMSSLLERIGEHADTNSHIVVETPLEHGTLQIPPPAPAATRHRGWSA